MPLTALTARVDAAELTISTLEIGYADVAQDIGEIFPRLASVELLAANNAWRLDNVDAGLDLIPVLFTNRIAAQESYFQGTLDQMMVELIAAQQSATDAGIAVQLAEQRYQDARDYIDAESLASRQAIEAEIYAELAAWGAGLSGEIQTASQGLQTSIDGITADLQNNFYTRVDTDLAITAAELRLSSSIDTEVNDIYANLSQIYYTRASVDGIVSAAITSLEGQITTTEQTLSGNIDEIRTLDLNALNGTALANLMNELQVDINGSSALVSETATAIADLQTGVSAGYLVRAQAGGAVSLLDLVAADDGTSPPTSIARLQADDILLDGSVGTNQLVVTDLSGTLINNGDFSRGDLRGWGVAPNGWSVVARDTGNAAAAIANMPTAYAIMTEANPLANQVFYQSDRLSVRAGDRLTVTFDYAGIDAGAGVNLSMGTQVEWLNGALQTVALSGVPVTGYASTAWASMVPSAVQVPVTAVYARVRLYILGGSVGRGIMSNIRMERQRPASILITPNSITGAQLVTTEALISNSAQLADAVISNAKIGNLQVDTAKIADLTVGTGKIANSAVTGAAASFGSGGGTAWTTISQFWASTEGGRTFVAWAHVQTYSADGGSEADAGAGQVRLLINGGVVYNSPFLGTENLPILRNAASAAGSTHVALQIIQTFGNGSFTGDAFLFGMEFKK